MTGKLMSALPESQFPVAWALHWAIDWFWSRTHVSGLFEWVCVSRTWSRAAKRLTRAGRLNKIRVPFNRMQLAAGLMFLSFGPMAWFIIRSIRWLRLVSLCAVLVSARSSGPASAQHLSLNGLEFIYCPLMRRRPPLHRSNRQETYLYFIADKWKIGALAQLSSEFILWVWARTRRSRWFSPCIHLGSNAEIAILLP